MVSVLFNTKSMELSKEGYFFCFPLIFVFRPGFVAFVALPCFAYLSIYLI